MGNPTTELVARLERLALQEMNDVSRDIEGVIPHALWDAKKEIERLRAENENVRFANVEGSQWVDCAKRDIERLHDLLTRARYGFVQHLCDDGKMSVGMSCLACEIDKTLPRNVGGGT